MQIAKDLVASIEYTLTDAAGAVIDSSVGNEPLAYLHGAGNIIPGLENALEGKKAGDSLTVTVAPEDGYGEKNDGLIQVVPKDMFQGVDNIEAGMQFHAQTDHGMQVITVAAVEGDNITVDGNHPLAGQTLKFDVKIIEVRAASEEELEHGHVHGAGGHHH
ncbi:MAG: peptidylprolyl isomerase [Moraxellaceae bacterium]|jgi:FKBP-type peptidyl-prolyl cis-trans isomerase SlyD|nr:peptidylprolyl isomerase [Moraxellaceae bacterium]MBP7230045.1 peptidylprolyl isomerase [Moraxellaceae bacterium]MBP8853007.1 peptidylprolyl isomerase [Moraxellaceae bacterium]MBP9730623.1 peptidylprolyl isomerase [Moraxellaceae bacterium]MCC6199787.1 peptidylprolyl isomerase [Moraxellaceae bacterium]